MMKIIDLHTHSLLSDGAYLPMELARRAVVKGYGFLAITDHVDASNISRVVPELVRAVGEINRAEVEIKVLVGAEVTHAPVEVLSALVTEARGLGAQLVVAHGETLAEPVVPGTNRRAIESGVDILAHPGLISEEDFLTAQKKGVLLEISGRKGHSLANGHLVQMWRRLGGQLVIDSDGHQAEDLFSETKYLSIGMGAGLSREEVMAVYRSTVAFARRLLNK